MKWLHMLSLTIKGLWIMEGGHEVNHAAGILGSTEYQFIAATPGGAVSCTCCGEGLLEMKFPFKPPSPPQASKTAIFSYRTKMASCV